MAPVHIVEPLDAMILRITCRASLSAVAWEVNALFVSNRQQSQHPGLTIFLSCATLSRSQQGWDAPTAHALPSGVSLRSPCLTLESRALWMSRATSHLCKLLRTAGHRIVLECDKAGTRNHVSKLHSARQPQAIEGCATRP